MLPSSTYQNNRLSAQSQRSEESNGEGFYIPMAFDPNPAPGPSPLARRENSTDPTASRQGEGRPNARDYFNAINSASRRAPIEQEKENKDVGFSADSPSDSRHSSQPNSPHIAYQYQDRGRKLSSDLSDQVRKKKEAASNLNNSIMQEDRQDTPTNEVRSRRNGENQNGDFMLQEAPKKKRTSKSDPMAPPVDTAVPVPKSRSAPSSATTQVTEQQVTLPSHESPDSIRSEATLSGSPRDMHGSRSVTSTDSPSSHSSPLSTQLKTLPERGDSLVKAKQSIHRKELDLGFVPRSSNSKSVFQNDDPPASAPPTTTSQTAAFVSASASKGLSKAQDSPATVNFGDAPPPPLRARERLALQGNSSSDSFVTPRAPPSLPNAHKVKSEPNGTIKMETLRNGEQPTSPKLPRHANADELHLDEDVRHGGDEGQPEHGGFLRRVSHSVRHARSYSDRGTRLSKEQKWPKSPLISSGTHSPAFTQGFSSPVTSSPESKNELTWFKSELRKERQKTLEQEQRLAELEAALEAKTSIKQMNTELREKRSTMVVLDTQKEIVVRELEVLTEHIAAAKKSGEPLDIGKLSNAVLREFAESLQKLKESFAPQIEDLTQRRNNIQEEIDNLSLSKDKSFQEFEQLSLKNAQLAELNNQLVHQIQELYKANAGPPLDIVRPPPNGLGIYTQHHKDRSNASMDVRDPRPSLTDSSMTDSTLVQEQEADPPAYLTQPQVVNIRKAQPKKFNWKKGGHNVAKGVTKGLKAAFNDGNRNQRDGQFTEGMPYGQMQQQDLPNSNLSRSQSQDPRPGLGAFFGNQKQRPQQWKNSPNGSMPTVNSDGGPGKAVMYGLEKLLADIQRSFVWL